MADPAFPAAPPPTPEQWLAVRRLLSARRAELGALAGQLYPGHARAAGTGLLTRQEWLPEAPVPLENLALRWEPRPPTPAVDPAGPLTGQLWPWRPGEDRPGGRYASYAEAVGALDRPALFENRVCYRLTGARLVGRPGLACGRCSYFDGVNLGHAVAHELAAAWAARGAPGPGAVPAGTDAAGAGPAGAAPVSLAGLPLRAAAGDPCDLSRRCATVAITTLTLRRGASGDAAFLLHWRDPARVNHAGGLYQVMPVGIFQPVTAAPAALAADFSLWRCLAREYSEELLGTSEDYPTVRGVLDYRRWPFHQRLAAALTAGGLAVWCLGLGVDPLTLATDLLTVAVFRDETFGSLFGGLVARNAEGRVVTEQGSAAIPFTAETVERFSGGSEPVQAAGAAVLRLAWRHRSRLLAAR